MIVSRFLTISACFFRVSSPVSGSLEALFDVAHLLDDLRQRAGPLAFLFLVLLLPPPPGGSSSSSSSDLSAPFSSSGSGLSGLGGAGSSGGWGLPAGLSTGAGVSVVSPSFSSRLSSAWSLGATVALVLGFRGLGPGLSWRAPAPRPARRASRAPPSRPSRGPRSGLRGPRPWAGVSSKARPVEAQARVATSAAAKETSRIVHMVIPPHRPSSVGSGHVPGRRGSPGRRAGVRVRRPARG